MSEFSVLIVDDDAGIRDALSDALELLGYRVITACNGLEALRALDREMPALVLLDIRMPVLDGRGFARAVARRQNRLPLVVMSADPDGAPAAREIGAIGFVAKPFVLADLMLNIKTAIARAAASQHHAA